MGVYAGLAVDEFVHADGLARTRMLSELAVEGVFTAAVGGGVARGGLFGRRVLNNGDLQNIFANNHINGLRLQQQLVVEQASAIFDENGYLLKEVIQKSKAILPAIYLHENLRNHLLARGGNLDNWSKCIFQPKSISDSNLIRSRIPLQIDR